MKILNILLLLSCFMCSFFANGKANEVPVFQTSPLESSIEEKVHIHCRVSGFLKKSNGYKLIVEGSLTVSKNLWISIDQSSRKSIEEKINAYIQNNGSHWTEQKKQSFKVEAFVPVKIKSELFGVPGGTRLEIGMEKYTGPDGNTHFYFMKKIIINGLPVLAQITNGIARLYFNETRSESDKLTVSFNSKGELLDDKKAKEPSISTPEGLFNHIMSECRVSSTP